MRRTSYQRGFVAGEKAAINYYAQLVAKAEGFEELGKTLEGGGPVADVAGILGRSIAGEDIEPHDYDEWSEDELRDERKRITVALDMAMHLRRPVDDEAAEREAFERIPEHLRPGIKRYLDYHIPMGSFLTAVFSNDLHEALGRADEGSRMALFEISVYLHNFAPRGAWGSLRALELWLTPPMPDIELGVEPNVELDVAEDGTTACPQCGGRHPVQTYTAEPGKVQLPSDGNWKRQHQVQAVWCNRVHFRVVGIEGKELES